MARKTTAEMRQMLRAMFPGRQGEVLVQILEALASDLTTAESNIEAIDTWGAALATKLNADAGVTDTDYDTSPL